MISRIEVEAREREMLAGYAARAAESRGRVYPQEPHPLRTDYQRDRDRIVHSAAFRRMDYKTQVFIPHLADHFRTRLTHTIEVAQISRTLARNLRLNEDLTEAIALVHDLGHTPFGHTGEDVLNELLDGLGGFNHNRQSLRIVDLLERRYPGHPGLNLTFEVREGIVKHETRDAVIPEEFHPHELPTLEASLVDKADELAYSAHDIDDGLNSGLIELDDLTELKIFAHPDCPPGLLDRSVREFDPDRRRYSLVRYMINRMATDLMETTARELKRNDIVDMATLRSCGNRVCSYSKEVEPEVRELKAFLYRNLYHHERLKQPARNARDTVRFLFERLVKKPDLMPERFRAMLESAKVEIVVADYIAGMTDRFAVRLAADLR